MSDQPKSGNNSRWLESAPLFASLRIEASVMVNDDKSTAHPCISFRFGDGKDGDVSTATFLATPRRLAAMENAIKRARAHAEKGARMAQHELREKNLKKLSDPVQSLAIDESEQPESDIASEASV
jgi:hypothetical protein